MNKSLKPSKFYGNSLNQIYNELEDKIEKAKRQKPYDPYELHEKRSILQPCFYKKEWPKQIDALTDAEENSCGDDILCCFVFQDQHGHRRFIVMYPEDFWAEVEMVPPENKVFYEVIPIFAPCFLYFDLEFETHLNEGKNGIKMTNTLIDISCKYIKKHWDYNCNKKMVVNLNSHRPGKFSKHLIFSTTDFAFENNLHVGYLVKKICNDLTNYLSGQSENHEILREFDKADLEDLYVETEKGKKLFIDTCVYTKNRHFRIYKATKYGKDSHLELSPECEFTSTQQFKNKDLGIFVNSLVSYLPRKMKMNLLGFDENKHSIEQTFSQYKKSNFTSMAACPKSPYPELDKYVSEHVKPGRVRDTKFFENKKIIFEILGNRFCGNINRQHKSNNIYIEVDLVNKCMYQKCHDSDCAGYCSCPIKLPPQVSFSFEDEYDSSFLQIETS